MKFWIGAASCSLRLPFAGSLKERRHVVRSIIDGARSRFAVSAADLGPLDLWQSVELGFTAAGSSSAEVSERLENLENFLRTREDGGEMQMVDFTREVFTYGDLQD